MKTIFKVMIVPAIVSLSLIACDNNNRQDRKNDRDEVQNSTTGSYRSVEEDNIEDDFSAARDKVRTGWDSRMAEINRELEEIDRKIEREKSASKQAWQQRRSELKEEKEALEERIERTGETSEKDWDRFKKEVDDDLDQLGRNVKDLFRDNDREPQRSDQEDQNKK